MQLEDVYIEEAVQEKVAKKHGVSREETEAVLLADEPKHFKTRAGRYMAIGFIEKYISVVYENHNGVAIVITAYPSSQWQVRMYKRK